MVLRLKARESRAPPAPPNGRLHSNPNNTNAGWSSPVARQAHNLKAAGSNPAPATNKINLPARIALFGSVALADVMAFSRFLPFAIRLRLAELRLPYRSFC